MPFVYTVQENANKPLPTYRFLDLFFPFENAQLFPIEAYHVDLFERDDVDYGKEFYHGDRKMEVLKHGFAVEVESLPANTRATHISLFDGTLQGLERTDVPAFCFQGHPEASPGPNDIGYLFDRFTALMEKN